MLWHITMRADGLDAVNIYYNSSKEIGVGEVVIEADINALFVYAFFLMTKGQIITTPF